MQIPTFQYHQQTGKEKNDWRYNKILQEGHYRKHFSDYLNKFQVQNEALSATRPNMEIPGFWCVLQIAGKWTNRRQFRHDQYLMENCVCYFDPFA